MTVYKMKAPDMALNLPRYGSPARISFHKYPQLYFYLTFAFFLDKLKKKAKKDAMEGIADEALKNIIAEVPPVPPVGTPLGSLGKPPIAVAIPVAKIPVAKAVETKKLKVNVMGTIGEEPMKPAKRGRGRPKGSKNKPKPVITIYPKTIRKEKKAKIAQRKKEAWGKVKESMAKRAEADKVKTIPPKQKYKMEQKTHKQPACPTKPSKPQKKKCPQ